MKHVAEHRSSALPPERLGAYTVLRTLTPEAAFHCLSEGGRQVVLKRLEGDCLLRGQLHPSIKERLQRVRELAQKHVATLQTVERIDDAAYLVWEYVEGQTFDDCVLTAQRTPAQLAALAREVILSIESLHAQGIVHGSIHGRNIIVTPTGEIFLTHISPLLYNDPTEDAAAMVQLLRSMVMHHGTQNTGLGEFAAQADPRQATLRQLASRLAVLCDSPGGEIPALEQKQDRGLRKPALIGAALATAVGLGIALVVYFSMNHRNTPTATEFEQPLDNVGSTR